MTKQEFDQFNVEFEESGMTLKGFMTTKGIPMHRYYYWKKRYNHLDTPVDSKGFIQIDPGQQANSVIRLDYPNGVSINFQSNPGTKALLKLINNKI